MKRTGAIIAAVCLLTALPFLGQAYTVDDPTFVAVARHLAEDPLGIASFSYDHLGDRVQRYILEMTHPPLWPYLLAGAFRIAGGDHEIPGHLLTMILAILAGIGMALLGRQAGVSPLEAGLLLVLSPPFLVLSHTVMSEVPSLAFCILGVVAFLRGRTVLASILLACAMGIAYQNAIVLLALAAGTPPRRWIPLAAPVAVLLGWLLLPAHAPLTTGIWPYASAIAAHPTSHIPIRAGYTLAALGLLVPLGLRAAISIRPGLPLAVCVLLITLGAGTFALGEPAPGPWGTLGFTILFAGGAGGVTLGMSRLRRDDLADPITRVLLVWFFTGFLLIALFLNFGAMRHTLILLPPLIILLLRREDRPGILWIGIVASGILGLALSIGDARFAATGRAIPRETLEACRWIRGEWGFRHYREKAGQRYLIPEAEPPRPGDRIVVPTQAATPPLPPDLAARLTLVHEIPLDDGYPIRTMNHAARAGLYSHVWGMLPFSLSREPLEVVRVYEVNWFLSRFPEGARSPYPVRPSLMEIGGRVRPSFLLHPPGEVSFSLRIPEDRILRVATGIPDSAWDQGSDGAEFRIEIRSDGGGWVEILSHHLVARGWQEVDVDLGPWGGKEVEILFLTGPGPSGSTAFDWAFWADPHLRRKEG
jgi:4-amino-4-deoxy-L-arabinose transferase-like glycosyltransferase